MHDITSLDCSRIAQDLQIRKVQVEAVALLLDEGNTVPFITRYRKERTGGLDEEVIRAIQSRIHFLRHLGERKQTILKSIEGQGKLTDTLRQAILRADTVKRLEDLYLPYKPKKRSLASKAREQGLEPLALAIWYSDPAAGNLDELLPALVNPEKELKTAEDVRAGVQNIMAEMMAETALIRANVRSVLWETGRVCAAKSDKLQEGQGLEYKDYFGFSEAVRQIPPHRILALNRGEKEHVIKVRFEWNLDAVKDVALKSLSEQLLNDAGRMPAPAAPPAACGLAHPETSLPEAAQSAEVAQPPIETAPVAEATTAVQESPPAKPQAAPLVEAMALEPLDMVLQGESLAGGEFKSPNAAFLRTVLDDALNRLLLPSLEREIRRELTDEAESHAVAVFARNLRSLLLQPPLRGKRVLAIDPGFRTGCKVAALDEYGNLLEHGVIYPHATHAKRGKEKAKESTPTASAAPTAPSFSAGGMSPFISVTVSIGVPIAEVPPLPPLEPAAEEIPPINIETPAPEAEVAPDAVAVATEKQPEAPTETVNQPAEAAPAASHVTPAAVPIDKRAEAKAKLADLVSRHHLQVAALGNGTGCRETEELIAELIATNAPELSYIVVNEAGASIYSVSPVGREEFPEFDATLRGTISIGRRLQDPLSELVKVDPQNIGVGLYQHDMSRKELKDSLEAVVESCVNQVGVDVNTASVPLLRHVSGLNQLVARELIDFRQQHGAFTTREALLQVTGLGPTRFIQAAGFLKIPEGPNPLDRTWIHPESYPLATQVLSDIGFTPNVIDDKGAQEEFQAKLKEINVVEMAKRLNVVVGTMDDILQALAKPGRDPREDLPAPIFKKGILKLEDLQPGMELKGTVLNVVDFGAFVDIGLKDSGLVHISQMANRYIKSPYDVVAVSDVVKIWVLTVDKERHRVSLTMIQPGSERKPPERREARPPRAPRGRRPDGPPGQPDMQAQGAGRPQHGRGPGRRGPGGPPARQPAPAQARPAATVGTSDGPAATNVSEPPRTPPPPPPPARKPRREPPRPKLSQAALEGKVPLRTFGELSALFAAKKDPEKKPTPPERAAEPAAAEAATIETAPVATATPPAGENLGETPS